MRQQTELMHEILTSKTAQEIIDYVAPVYGTSYVGLWLFQVMGLAAGDFREIAEKLFDETCPITSEFLLDAWEDHYDLYRNNRLTTKQRQERLLQKIRFRAAYNPKRLADAMAAVLGVPVKITERVAKNTFRVDILDSVSDIGKMVHALTVLDSKKPAHLIYTINVDSKVDETNLKIATAITQSESYRVGVEAIKLVLQKTLEEAIKLGAAVSVGEEFHVEPRNVSVETTTNLEYNILTASPVSSREVYSVAEIKQAARIAVETAFNLASSVSNSEEFTIEEVATQ